MFWQSLKGRPQQSGDEQVSVILKRKVPVSEEQPVLSWLGGLPMMPRSVEWPRDSQRSPLHFLAQIHCGDLPADLWGGLGPREGWLLLFAHVLKLEDEAEGKTVQVLHIGELGPETQPPKTMPTVRHAMRDYIASATPEIRPGVPKLWRKWPLEMVVQRYRASETDWQTEGAPFVSGADLYGAPEDELSLHAPGSFDLDRPLTWRGAYYVVEGLLRDLDPKEYAEQFHGGGGLAGPPEPDQNAFNAEFNRRVALRQQSPDFGPGWWPDGTDRKALTAEIQAERRTGWMPRSFTALDAEVARSKDTLADYERKLAEAEAMQDDDRIRSAEEGIRYYKGKLDEEEANRRYLMALFEPYGGPDGEEAFNAEIERSAEAHLAWAKRQGEALEYWRDRILAQDLDLPLPAAEWDELAGALSESRSAYWVRTFTDTRVLEKVERSLNFQHHLEMAIREDVLDLYARGDAGRSALPAPIVEDLERRLRHLEAGRPHRMGGHPNPVHNENGADDDPLLFQIASDQALGWGWGDLGALYVTIEGRDLRRNRFHKVDAWIE